MKTVFLSALFAAALVASAFANSQPGVSPGAGTRYATDAYPGFDREQSVVAPERKEPRWFGFIFGPNRTTAPEQFAYCQGLMAAEDWSKAAGQLDALVRAWPTSDEAPKAQQQLAEIERDHLDDYDEAQKAYMYLLDFYSLQCDYDKIADLMYDAVCEMRRIGRTVVFFHFDNTVDVRRAFEACVLRAPGAKWVPQAMLAIGELREDEGELDTAIKVYENLINVHSDSPEAKIAILRQANVRMEALRKHAYNRERCRDTIDYLKLALTACDVNDVAQIREFLNEAVAHLEAEAYRAAKFYDSNTRTVRSAVNAYEEYLRDYPEGEHAEEAKSRLAILKGLVK